MKFEVMVPVLFTHNFHNFFDSILGNSVLPTRLIVIDNTDGKTPFIPPTNKFQVDVFKSRTKQVNESWNLGLKKASRDADFVGIYNDDIILNKHFFKRVLQTFDASGKRTIGVVCPNTIEFERTSFSRPGTGPFKLVWVRKREGWCFTMSRKARNLVPPIPCHLIKQFHGDDWIWFHTKTGGCSWFKDWGNHIWHLTGESISRTGDNINRMVERQNWENIHFCLSMKQSDKIQNLKRIERCPLSMEEQLTGLSN